MKSVQTRSSFCSVFSCIQSEYGEIRTRKNYVFGLFHAVPYFQRHSSYNNVQFASYILRPSQKILMTLKRGNFPDILKYVDITRVFRKDYATDKNNYRPISSRSNFSKMFEKLIFTDINSSFMKP